MSEIWDVATRFLANRMKTRAQLEKHLQSKEYNESEIANVLTRIEEYGYINDTDYASAYIAHCIPKGQTLRRIKKDLEARGVSENHISAGVKQYTDETGVDPTVDEFQRGMNEARKVIGNNMPVETKLLGKAGRKLIALGYRSETVYAILGEFMRGKKQ